MNIIRHFSFLKSKYDLFFFYKRLDEQKSTESDTESYRISYVTKESYLCEDLSMVQSIRLGITHKFVYEIKERKILVGVRN